MTTVTDVEMTYEAKLERSLERVNRLAKEARTVLRLFGPRLTTDKQDELAIRHCSFCNPPPRMYSCPLCGFACDQRWRMQLHVETKPGWCTKRAEKKIREWAKKS